MKFDNLIVIAAHGEERAEALIERTNSAHPILVVRTDTGGMSRITCRSNVIYTVCPFSGFDTGAYLWAYWTFYANRYLFLQDSLIPHGPDYADLFFEKMPPADVVPWVGFPFPMWDSREQEAAARYVIGPASPRLGIFGPVFAATRDVLDELRNRRLLPPFPTHKENAQGKEREWAIAFESIGAKVEFLVGHFDKQAMSSGMCPGFKKIFAGRT